ncbi:hypothetical protein niasHT_037364 [Heterodera trifolii]|uniref:Replication factor A C-terminal domain-containing protein n=1 Tax=Heterodera trifolii TaxID=157864 RepID=A0ABD2J711_9BILA
MSGLSRFQLSTATAGQQKRKSDGAPAKTKTLKEVLDFKSAGVFYVSAKVVNLQYKIYKACPLKNRGFFCRKKLDDEMRCTSCDHIVKSPMKSLFLRVEIADRVQPESSVVTTMFSYVGEKYLGINALDVDELSENEPEKLLEILEAKLDKEVVVKVQIKESKGHFEGQDFDWIIMSMCEDNKKDDDEKEEEEKAQKKVEKKDGELKEESEDDDGDEIQLIGETKSTSTDAVKKAKKN